MQFFFILFFTSLGIQLLFSFILFSRLLKYKSVTNKFNKAISVIICARNEADNLKEFLPYILKQKYSNFEVIVVNDQSQDNTESVLASLQKQHPELRVVNIEKHIKHPIGKKFALTLGIKSARNEYILLTDADCMPSSDRWIDKMVQNFSKDKVIVLGYGAYRKGKGLLNKIIRFDTFNVALQSFSFALLGMPYMGVGRNLAYKRSIFFENKGFASHLHLASGDDDLFVQEIAQKTNTTIELSLDAHTISNPKETWKEWVCQKRRHITTSRYYHFKFKFFLSLWPLSICFLWFSFIILCVCQDYLIIILPFFIFRFIIFYIYYFLLMRRLRLFDLIVWFPLIEISHIFFQLFFVLLNFFKKPINWR